MNKSAEKFSEMETLLTCFPVCLTVKFQLKIGTASICIINWFYGDENDCRGKFMEALSAQLSRQDPPRGCNFAELNAYMQARALASFAIEVIGLQGCYEMFKILSAILDS